MTFPISIPTSTIIACDGMDPYQVCVIEQAKKHRRRKTLVGGKLELPPSTSQICRQSFLDCAHKEWAEEAGGQGAILVAPELWAVRTDPYGDVREVTLSKACNELPPDDIKARPVIGHYGCPDCIFLAVVHGTPAPRDGEAKQCFFLDVRDIRITRTEEESQFGAQHDLILVLYRHYLQGRAPTFADLSDFTALRRRFCEQGE